jgi:hypothetical protein
MDSMDQIREAFKKVKEDMDFLKEEILSLNREIKEIRVQSSERTIPTEKTDIHTDAIPIPTDISPFKPLKAQNLAISTGNEGVPTNRQTNQQTDQQTEKRENSMENALKVLNSLDSVKREIRLKFKDLTEQEFLVFSTLYQMDDQREICDYKVLSKKLNLSESSVRDYIGKLIKKDIPVEKAKIKNKNVQLSLSSDLKKVASLSTILQLRSL